MRHGAARERPSRAQAWPSRSNRLSSTEVFYGQAATITIHMPPGSTEAVLLIEALDQVASITLAATEARRLAEVLLAKTERSEEAALAQSMRGEGFFDPG